MTDEIYHKLAKHLDQLLEGFNASDPKDAIRLLKKLFTPEEAELACHLTLDREDG